MGLNIIVFFLLTAAFLFIFNIKFSDIRAFFVLSDIGKKKYSQKNIIQNYNSNKKENQFLAVIMKRKKNLALMGKENLFEKILIASFLSGFLGVFVSIMTYNVFLAPALFLLLFFVPILITIIYENNFEKDLVNELESSLSLITNTYLRTENIEEAVSENIEYVNYPVKKMFENFLYEIKYVNSNIKKALLRMRNSCGNEIFSEWTDAVVLCQEDKSSRVLLQPIVNKLSDIKAISGDLDLKFYEPLKDFITMALLVVLNIPMMRFLNKEWFFIYTGSVPGKIMISISVFCIFLGLFSLIKTLKPIGDKE